MQRCYKTLQLFTLPTILIIVWYCFVQISRASERFEILVLDHLLPDQKRPVTPEILALNMLRKEAGLGEIDENWKIVAHDFHVSHTELLVLLDPKERPAKVIMRDLGEPFTEPRWTELTIQNKNLSGKAATWLGQPPVLYQTEKFMDGKLNGVTTYYSQSGNVLASIEYKNDQPWTGTLINRHGFQELTSQTSYKNATLDGEERYFENGALVQLRNYRDGILHGQEQRFHLGQLRSESKLKDGIVIEAKSWHQNRKPAWEEYYTTEGKREGVRRGWDELGNIISIEHFKDGKLHGSQWYEGHHEIWYWNDKALAEGITGQKKFETTGTF